MKPLHIYHLIVTIALGIIIPELAFAQADKPMPMGLPRSTPEAQGVSSEIIRQFVEAADQKVNTMHSFMLVRHGHVIAECWWKPQSAETPHVLHSLSKSFTSTAVGFAIEEGKLSLDDEVLNFFPDQAPAEPSKNLKAMRVRDLLTMSTGHEKEVKFTSEVPWVKAFLAAPRTVQAGNALPVQHAGHVYAFGDRTEGDGKNGAGLLAAPAVRPIEDRKANMGVEPARDHFRRLWIISSHGRYS